MQISVNFDDSLYIATFGIFLDFLGLEYIYFFVGISVRKLICSCFRYFVDPGIMIVFQNFKAFQNFV